MSIDYPRSVEFLYALANEHKTGKLGLDRIGELTSALGDPQERTRFIHVAGTNGKGSTCAMIESSLRAAGFRTGLYTSPHLLQPTERIQIDGSPVDEEAFVRAFEQVRDAASHLRSGEPTYFETVTAMAFLLFADRRVEWVVLEVGLGGRLDATNVVTPELCVITPVDYDHENWLGDTIEAIAREKAGILKRGVPAVFALQRPDAGPVLESRAAELNVPVTRVADWQVKNLELCRCSSRFRLVRDTTFDITCPLAGEHQVTNAAAAVAALREVGVAPGAIERGIAQTRWPGRLECVSKEPEIWLDGAHNPAGARSLARHIERFFTDKKLTLIFGAMRDKAVPEIAAILFPLADRLILTAPSQARAIDPHLLADLAGHTNFQVADHISEALKLAQDTDITLVTGSLYLVGEARALLVK